MSRCEEVPLSKDSEAPCLTHSFFDHVQWASQRRKVPAADHPGLVLRTHLSGEQWTALAVKGTFSLRSRKEGKRSKFCCAVPFYRMVFATFHTLQKRCFSSHEMSTSLTAALSFNSLKSATLVPTEGQVYRSSVLYLSCILLCFFQCRCSITFCFEPQSTASA